MNSVVVGSSAPWICPACAVEVAAVQQYCTVCLRARPMPHSGVPQIFSGHHMHFNGIIPRTLKHPSHAVEWRMAERHGATCEAVFDPNSTTILIYRPGYERSDKVRLCVERYHHIPCVPISWLLDSLLQSRQIHPVLYRLQSVPAVALPTVRGPSLPHHQHPFFVLNAEEYTLAPLPGRSVQVKQAESGSNRNMDEIGPLTAPLPDAIWTSVDIWDAAQRACSPASAGGGAATDTEDDAADVVAKRAGGSGSVGTSLSSGIDVFENLLHRNRSNKMLFQGMKFVLSPSLASHALIGSVIAGFGGEVVPSSAIHDDATHVVYHNDDKKDQLMLDACHASATSRQGELFLVTNTWLEDCLMLGEVIPALAIYAPSSKLRATLQKKWEKRISN